MTNTSNKQSNSLNADSQKSVNHIKLHSLFASSCELIF